MIAVGGGLGWVGLEENAGKLRLRQGQRQRENQKVCVCGAFLCLRVLPLKHIMLVKIEF